VRSDGSCERTIIQPRQGYLPRVARPPDAALDSAELSADWIREWTSVTGADRPPQAAPDDEPLGKHEYFKARGTFESPADIPLHYLYVNKAEPELGLSALTRQFARTDFGLFVEYRWQETVTNAVTRARFVEGIEEFLQVIGPCVTSGLPDALGDDYDAAPLVTFLQKEAPAGIKELAATYYDARLHRLSEEATYRQLIEVLKQRGFVWKEKAKDPIEEIVKVVIQKYVRRADGKSITADDANKILDLIGNFDWKSHNEKFGFEEGKLEAAFNSAFGIYPLINLSNGTESFDYSLELPGTMLESNGRLRKPNQTFWKFSVDDTFPVGYEMTARSVAYNLDAQKKVCGRVVVGDGRAVEEFINLVGRDGPLLEAVRNACVQGKLDPIESLRPGEHVSAPELRAVKALLGAKR
jgi:hypothetical protein